MRNFAPYVCPICGSQLPRAAARCFFCDHALPIYKGKPRLNPRETAPQPDGLRPSELPRIYVTTHDFGRLEPLARLGLEDDAASRELLRSELDRAIVCDESDVPPDIVRIGSTVLLRDKNSSGTLQKIRGVLVYPGEWHPRLPAIPVSSPLGAAVLGLSAGDVMGYAAGDGQRHVVRVVRVYPGTHPLVAGAFDSRKAAADYAMANAKEEQP